MQHSILSARERASLHAIANQTTQITGAIRAVNTGPLHTVIEPPASAIVHIGSVQPSLMNLTPMTQNVLVGGYRMAYLHRRIRLHDALYIIAEIWADQQQTGKILARMERIEEDA
jgi:hypothetical protein